MPNSKMPKILLPSFFLGILMTVTHPVLAQPNGNGAGNVVAPSASDTPANLASAAGASEAAGAATGGLSTTAIVGGGLVVVAVVAAALSGGGGSGSGASGSTGTK